MSTDNKRPKPQIVPLPNGPYYYFPTFEAKVCPGLSSSTGEKREYVPGIALCRCGGSNNKPFCDGTHGKNGFTDEKKTDGKWDVRTDYKGTQITIHDNRGICAHAGECTSNLAKVFKLKEEPWIDPDGATAEEIIATIKRCPSGALSYSIDGVEHRNRDDAPQIVVSKDGPYHVKGGIELVGAEKGEGASDEHYTLCRCGGSKNKPFCDGTHWHIGFKDEKN